MLWRNIAVAAACVILFGSFPIASLAGAQTRVNDRDMEALMRNLRDDSKTFQSAFKDSIQHSVIRKTSREKDDKNLVAGFVKETEAMLNHFKKTRHADASLPSVLDTATRINRIVYELKLNPQTTSRWEKVRSELHQVAAAYGVPDPLDREVSRDVPSGDGPGTHAGKRWAGNALLY